MAAIEEISPDGRFLVRFDVDHGRMSHEIWTPGIFEAATGRELLHVRQVAVDGRPEWRPGGFAIELRYYHLPELRLGLVADLDREIFRFDGSSSDEPLATLSDRVDEQLLRQMKAADRQGRDRHRLAIAKDAAVVLLGLAALAAAAWFALK